jgi:excisionase family DNA binding protein
VVTVTAFLLGEGGPELRVPPELAALLWPVVHAHARELEVRGATDRLRPLLPLLRAWSFVAGEANVRRASGFRSKATNGIDDPLAADFLRGEGDWLSTEQAAAAVGCSRQWVAVLARRGEIEARRVGNRWVISPAAVVEARKRRTA